MSANVTRNFAPTSRVPNVDRIFEVKQLDQLCKVVRVGIHLISNPRLAGAPMSPAIVRDAAITAVCQKQHLVLKRVCAKRPTVAENYGLSLAPVLVIDHRTVLRCKRRHRDFPFRVAAVPRQAHYAHSILRTNGKSSRSSLMPVG